MKTYSFNRRASFDYQILQTFEAGIELNGHETKSIKTGRLNLNAAYAIFRQNELWLINADISSFQPKNAPSNFQPNRSRRLLLNKKEVKSLAGKLHNKSLNIIPLKAYSRGKWIKLELGLAKRKNKTDQREKLRKEAIKKEINQVVKKQRNN